MRDQNMNEHIPIQLVLRAMSTKRTKIVGSIAPSMCYHINYVFHSIII